MDMKRRTDNRRVFSCCIFFFLRAYKIKPKCFLYPISIYKKIGPGVKEAWSLYLKGNNKKKEESSNYLSWRDIWLDGNNKNEIYSGKEELY